MTADTIHDHDCRGDDAGRLPRRDRRGAPLVGADRLLICVRAYVTGSARTEQIVVFASFAVILSSAGRAS